jgi:hypothetical protein
LEKKIKDITVISIRNNLSDNKILSQANIIKEMQSSLNNLKNNISNMIELKNNFQNIPNDIQNLISESINSNSKIIENDFNQFSKKVLNKNSKVISYFNLIQTKINELKHFKSLKQENDNSNFFLFNNDDNQNINEINDLDERTYYVVNYNIDIILPKNYICKKKDLIQNNAKVSIKIINKGLNVIPKKSKIMLIKKDNIYFENVIINETITKDKDYSCYLNLKLINNNNNITEKQKIVFGLFQSNNMLIKQFEFIFSIS